MNLPLIQFLISIIGFVLNRKKIIVFILNTIIYIIYILLSSYLTIDVIYMKFLFIFTILIVSKKLNIESIISLILILADPMSGNIAYAETPEPLEGSSEQQSNKHESIEKKQLEAAESMVKLHKGRDSRQLEAAETLADLHRGQTTQAINEIPSGMFMDEVPINQTSVSQMPINQTPLNEMPRLPNLVREHENRFRDLSFRGIADRLVTSRANKVSQAGLNTYEKDLLAKHLKENYPSLYRLIDTGHKKGLNWKRLPVTSTLMDILRKPR